MAYKTREADCNADGAHAHRELRRVESSLSPNARLGVRRLHRQDMGASGEVPEYDAVSREKR